MEGMDGMEGVEGMGLFMFKFSKVDPGVFKLSLRVKINYSSLSHFYMSVIYCKLAFGYFSKVKQKLRREQGLRLKRETVRGRDTGWVRMELPRVVVESEHELDLFIDILGGTEDGIVLDILDIKKIC